jgi:hypothetical protein
MAQVIDFCGPKELNLYLSIEEYEFFKKMLNEYKPESADEKVHQQLLRAVDDEAPML